MKLRSFAAITVVFALCGCTTRFAMWTDEDVAPPTTPPKIILGQSAIYWGTYEGLDKAIVDAWRQTGLFKEVLLTDSSVAPPQGTYIHTSCSGRIEEQSTMGMFPIMSLMTVGIIPAALDFEKYDCSTQFYQNGSKISESYSSHTYKRMWSSWVAWLMYYGDEVLDEGRVTAANQIVAKQLANLKKTYP